MRPAGWQETGETIGSAFAADAECRAAVIVDQQPPTDSGPAPSVEASVVQVCAQPNDGRSLDAYLAATYGAGLPGFASTTLDGLEGYRSVDGSNQLIFVQTDRARFQIATSVVAGAALEPDRTQQITSILDSFDFS